MALPLRRYLTKALPPAPPSVDFTSGAAYAMFGNDSLGDCTCAGLANYFATCAAQEKGPFTVTAEEVKAFYFSLSGNVDSGLFEGDVLRHAKAMGFPLDGRLKLDAWVSVGLGDMEMVKSLTSLFWCVYLGVELPKSAQNQAVWDAPTDGNFTGDNEPGSWGGHCIVMPKYETDGPTFITWGTQKKATWQWLHAFGDECYVLLDENRASAIGVDWEALLADMKAVSQ